MGKNQNLKALGTAALSAFLLTVLASCPVGEPLPPWQERPEGFVPVMPSRASAKRGVAYNFNTPNTGIATEADMDLLAPGIRWFYNWSPGMPAHVNEAARERGLVFIPQIWNDHWNFDNVLNNLRELIAENPGIRWIMGYNEPNLVDQANMTPARAAQDWPRFVRLARELDLKIISPAMNFGTMAGFENPIVWLTEFFEQPGVYVEDLHAIRIHTYMSHASALKWYVEQFKQWDLPIWVTEFSAWYYSTSEEFQMQFMSEALVYLELNPWIEKYFWFIPKGGWAGTYNTNPPFHHLLTVTDPPRLTPLGEVYVHMPTFDRDVFVPTGRRMVASHITNVNTSENLLVPGVFDRSVHFRPSTNPVGDREILDIHNFTANVWVEYQVEVPASGTSSVSFRNVAPSATAMDIHVNGLFARSVEFSGTHVWRTTAFPLELDAGRHTIRLTVRSGNLALNWLKLE